MTNDLKVYRTIPGEEQFINVLHNLQVTFSQTTKAIKFQPSANQQFPKRSMLFPLRAAPHPYRTLTTKLLWRLHEFTKIL